MTRSPAARRHESSPRDGLPLLTFELSIIFEHYAVPDAASSEHISRCAEHDGSGRALLVCPLDRHEGLPRGRIVIGATPIARIHTEQLAKFSHRKFLTEPDVDRLIASVAKVPKTPFNIVLDGNTLQSCRTDLVLQKEPAESKYANQQ